MGEVQDLGNGVKVSIPKGAQPVIPPSDPVTDQAWINLYAWQKSQLEELKSINGKLSWFVFLSIVAIVVSFISLLK